MIKLKNTILIIIVILLLLFTVSCEKVKNGKQIGEEDVTEFCKSYVHDYYIVEENDGQYLISLMAPDFGSVINMINEQNIDIDVNSLKQIIKKNPDLEKEYVFEVNELEEDKIENAFFEQISYDLMVSLIENVEYTEEWSIEE